jgi:hypothetical protein
VTTRHTGIVTFSSDLRRNLLLQKDAGPWQPANLISATISKTCEPSLLLTSRFVTMQERNRQCFNEIKFTGRHLVVEIWGGGGVQNIWFTGRHQMRHLNRFNAIKRKNKDNRLST